MAFVTVARRLDAAFRRAEASWRTPRVRRRLARLPRPYRLHLGCGTRRLQGWINLDMHAADGLVDLVWDLRFGIPLADATCRLVYSEHLLEHLPVEAGVRLLRESRRVLEPGGVVRIAMPSLDAILRKAVSDWRDQDWLEQPEHGFIQTRAEMLNVAFRWWGHEWLYDREELHRRLAEAGFRQVRDVEWGRSPVPDLQELETRRDSLLICEAERD